MNLSYLLVVIACVFGLFLILVRPFSASKYIDRMRAELPLFTWKSVSDLVQEGYPRWACRKLLPGLYKDGYVKIRLRNKPEESLPADTKWLFVVTNLDALEFCLMRRRKVPA